MPGEASAETQKLGEKRGGGSAVVGNLDAQSMKTEVPQVAAVANEVLKPLGCTVAGKAGSVVDTVPVRHGTKRQPRQQHSPESQTDHVSAEVLVRDAEIGKIADRTTAPGAAEPMHAEACTHTVGKDHKSPVEPVPLQAPRATRQWAGRHQRRKLFTPVLDMPLDIRAERTRLSAWFRRCCWGCRLVNIAYGSTQYTPETFLTISPGGPGKYYAAAQLLFQVLGKRYENGSTIITTNRTYKEWALTFANDATLTSAVLDRVVHHCETIIIEGESYRMKGRIDNE